MDKRGWNRHLNLVEHHKRAVKILLTITITTTTLLPLYYYHINAAGTSPAGWQAAIYIMGWLGQGRRRACHGKEFFT